ncbi:hypothetical protein NDU88_006089 [Pleurodeles waltl]|uniref:Uncharacterized protein n=1 Tax=Pleurodeles waltl TaxID=8319 RepID=A0AAV7SNL4_PLEWA|nr:hypothetical protein NDU88_006089 [Pleurodeles waltl]
MARWARPGQDCFGRCLHPTALHTSTGGSSPRQSALTTARSRRLRGRAAHRGDMKIKGGKELMSGKEEREGGKLDLKEGEDMKRVAKRHHPEELKDDKRSKAEEMQKIGMARREMPGQ